MTVAADIDTVVRGHALVADVRRAAAVHNATWEVLVPDSFHVDLRAEAAEDAAYATMAAEKARLREHICETYGISIRELSSLAMA